MGAAGAAAPRGIARRRSAFGARGEHGCRRVHRHASYGCQGLSSVPWIHRTNLSDAGLWGGNSKVKKRLHHPQICQLLAQKNTTPQKTVLRVFCLNGTFLSRVPAIRTDIPPTAPANPGE